MTGNSIRQKYLANFQTEGHAVIPPAPLVPQNDPTTLFTSSGMQPLVPFLKGEPHPMGTRLVDSQPSFRAEDINEVGDNRHTTFFEMLGNWSLGDYFKSKQLPWFFNFLTGSVGLDPARLYVTVFAGNDIVPRDDESIAVWQTLFKSTTPAKLGSEGIDPATKIYLYADHKNWWSRAGIPANMPIGEIGGPDSEVFYDFDPAGSNQIHAHSIFKTKPCHVNCDCGRFLEIGNSVFMQYVKTAQGFDPLPKQNVDFGGGLERITAAANDDPDVFKIDLLWPIVAVITEATGKPYSTPNLEKIRIIADHLRAAVMMLWQGIEPSNKLQGYILRRLIRRSVLKLQQLGYAGTPAHFASALCTAVSTIYRSVYVDPGSPDLARVISELSQEMDRFAQVLKRGLKEFEKYDHLTGKNAFDLLQSYGFPWELSFELAAEQGQSLDRQEFAVEFKKHQERSRSASKGLFKGGLADHSETIVKYHTATHLLHAALRQILGNEVQQMGSNITSQRLRFDFKHPNRLTDEEKQQIEALINQKIAADLPVVKTTEPKDVALQSGAMAFFREKYPDTVSVYTIGQNPQSDWFSKELCGGPHVASTGVIGPVTIKKEESVGAGVRRIYMTLAGVD